MTREAAQEERRAVERELAKRGEELKESQARLKEKDASIAELSTAGACPPPSLAFRAHHPP